MKTDDDLDCYVVWRPTRPAPQLFERHKMTDLVKKEGRKKKRKKKETEMREKTGKDGK